jgi:cellulose synthase/poly-beta-1,6-N-acetylglucosamine synthase-like glycosyltransferase
MDYTVVIPSYKRAETCRDKTLAVLHEYKIPAERIVVVVADTEQEALYKETLKPGTYGKIRVGLPGVASVRNWIFNNFPKGEKLVCCDDDIRGFIEYTPSTKRHEQRLRSLKGIIERGFKECEKAGASLWGVYPSANGYFMKPTVTTDLRFIIGSFWGCINPGKDIQVERGEKDDYERSIKFYIQDGSVVRLNFVSPKTAYYKEPGGMQTRKNRHKLQLAAVKALSKKYPKFVKVNTTRKSGFPEILLADREEKDREEKGVKN